MGEPVVGANVVVKGTTVGAISDLDGNFSVNVKDLKKGVLVVSFVGYNTHEEALKGRNKVGIKLESSVINLGEVVAIGYGTQTRRQITGSVANVSEKDFNTGVTREATDLLQGRVAGLNITSGSGDVSSAPQIRLRGTSTLQNDQGPMIVIDGVPGGDMSTVAPDDIESISVLKDASSAAIYGSRAAGGVILITTKRGSGSNTQISYNGYVTADVVANKPDMLNAQEWRDANKQLGNDISVFNQYNADTDWFGEMMRTGISQSHSLSLSGGSSKSNYRASYTFLDRNGIAKDNSMTRHNFRFQFQQRAINDRLRISLTGSASLTDMQMPYGDNYILAYNMAPILPIKNPDGSWMTAFNAEYDQGNPIQNQELNYRKRSNNYFYGQGDVQFEIIEGLNAKVSLYKSRSASDYSRWDDPTTSIGLGNNGLALRDGMQIIRAKEEFGAKAVLVTRDSVEHITSNSADAGVFDIEYDYHIENNGTIKDLFDKAKEFLSKTNVPKYKKVVYISHPFEGKCENLNDIQEIVFNLIKEHPDHLFLSPVHCFGFEYSMLDYNQGLNECLWLLAKSDEMWVFGDYKNSKGCLAEIEFCKNHAIKYQIFDEKRGS